MTVDEAQAALTAAIRVEQAARKARRDARYEAGKADAIADDAGQAYDAAVEAAQSALNDLYRAAREDTAARKAAEPAGNEE